MCQHRVAHSARTPGTDAGEAMPWRLAIRAQFARYGALGVGLVYGAWRASSLKRSVAHEHELAAKHAAAKAAKHHDAPASIHGGASCAEQSDRPLKLLTFFILFLLTSLKAHGGRRAGGCALIVVSDPNSPQFDLEKYLTSVAGSSAKAPHH